MTDDLERLCTTLGETLVGEDLQYDALYGQMDELASAAPAQEMGESVGEGRDPDYRQLLTTALKLWDQTRDLRVATFYTIAKTNLEGLSGLKNGLQVIAYLIEELWDNFYPQLDPDDDNDPTERINILNMLSPKSGAFSDPIEFISHFRQLKLLPQLPYTLRDLLIAQGVLSSQTQVDANLLQAQARAVPFETLTQYLALTVDIEDLLTKISTDFNYKVADSGYLNFESLTKELKHLKRFYQQFSEDSVPTDNNVQHEPEIVTHNSEQPVVVAAPVGVASFDLKSYQVKSRSEALMLIQKCSDYFKKAEPTSPLPFLLQRSLRMAEMNFVDILAEIDQDALGKVKEQLGVLPTTEDN